MSVALVFILVRIIDYRSRLSILIKKILVIVIYVAVGKVRLKRLYLPSNNILWLGIVLVLNLV